MTEEAPKPVCAECEHLFVDKWALIEMEPQCAADEPAHHPVYGHRVLRLVRCADRNGRGECKLFKPRAPVRPWWKFWGAKARVE